MEALSRDFVLETTNFKVSLSYYLVEVDVEVRVFLSKSLAEMLLVNAKTLVSVVL